MSKRYLVTGSSGFIGQHLIAALKAASHQLIPFDLKDSSGDIRNLKELEQSIKDCEGVFHLAAIASVQQSIEHPQETYQTNVIGTQNVFKAASALGLPVVYASSAAVYGDNSNIPLKETEPPKPLSPYAEHKHQNERDAQAWGQKAGLKTFGLRFFNIYGPGQDPASPYSGVISIFHKNIQMGSPITIYGDGFQTRDFVHVSEAVNALVWGIQHASGQAPIGNVCTGQEISLLALIDALKDTSSQSIEIIKKPARTGDIVRSCGDPTYLKDKGFTASRTLRDGIISL